MIARRLTSAPDFLRRLLALGSAALVLLLGIAASSPTLHALAHAHADSDHHALPGSAEATDTCAIVLFGQGVALTVAAAAPAPFAAAWHELTFSATGELLLVAPPYLHLPERGPPAV